MVRCRSMTKNLPDVQYLIVNTKQEKKEVELRQ